MFGLYCISIVQSTFQIKRLIINKTFIECLQ